jgi:hypothetical protein
VGRRKLMGTCCPARREWPRWLQWGARSAIGEEIHLVRKIGESVHVPVIDVVERHLRVTGSGKQRREAKSLAIQSDVLG